MAKCIIIFVVLTKRTRAAAAAGVKKFVTVMVDSGPETASFFSSCNSSFRLKMKELVI